jgi:hypothetical protein
MIKVSVEVREGATFSRVAVQADTISRAVSITKRCHPGRDVRVVFPIDPEGFFAGDSKKTAGNTAGNTKNSSPMMLLPDRIR